MTKLERHSDTTRPVLQQCAEIYEKTWTQTQVLLITARASKDMLSFKHSNKIPLVWREGPALGTLYMALWTGQYRAPLLIYNTETRWWCWKMITAKQRDTFTAGRYRTPLRNVHYIAELKTQLYLSLNAIISSSPQNLTLIFLMVLFSFTYHPFI